MLKLDDWWTFLFNSAPMKDVASVSPLLTT